MLYFHQVVAAWKKVDIIVFMIFTSFYMIVFSFYDLWVIKNFLFVKLSLSLFL